MHSCAPENFATPFSSIPPTPLSWLWPSRIPRGKITLLTGDPGSGKTALTLDLAARLSTATPLPPLETRNPTLETPPAATLLLSPDDNAADTLRPKLDALHANLSLIHTLPDFPPFDAPGSLLQLDAACKSIPHLALLVIDPITHYLGLSDRHLPLSKEPRDYHPCGTPLRSTLHALAHLARSHNLALLLTSRLTKKLPALDPLSLHRSIGSLAFASTARSVLLLTPAPPSHVTPGDSPRGAGLDCGTKHNPPSLNTAALIPHTLDPIPQTLPSPTHLLLTLKSNLTAPPAPLPYTLADTLTWHPELHTPLPAAKPEKPLDPDSALAAAITFLHTLLSDGPLKATRVRTAALANAFSPATLRRAKDHLAITCTWSPEWSAWFWSLPDDHTPIPSLARTLEKEMSISPFLASDRYIPSKGSHL